MPNKFDGSVKAILSSPKRWAADTRALGLNNPSDKAYSLWTCKCVKVIFSKNHILLSWRGQALLYHGYWLWYAYLKKGALFLTVAE
jgi:hypothetical protein